MPHTGHDNNHEEEARAGGSFWSSRPGLAFAAFLAIALFLLLSEHCAHALGFLPFLLLLACPLLHVFMHSGYGGHGIHKGVKGD